MVKQQVLDALNRQATVALIGPRQVGKTTLAQQSGGECGALYLDLEDSGKLINAKLVMVKFYRNA